MTDKPVQEEAPVEKPSNESGESPTGGAPYESLLSKIVERIKDQPFLFLIAIAALLVALVVVGSGLGSADLRFVVIVIAFLALVGVVGYYARQPGRTGPGTAAGQEPQARGGQQIEAAGGGTVERPQQVSTAAGDQTIIATGPGSVIRDPLQMSGVSKPEPNPAQTAPAAAAVAPSNQESQTALPLSPFRITQLKQELAEWQRRYESNTQRIDALDKDLTRTLDSEQKLALQMRRDELAEERAGFAQKAAVIEMLLAEATTLTT